MIEIDFHMHTQISQPQSLNKPIYQLSKQTFKRNDSLFHIHAFYMHLDHLIYLATLIYLCTCQVVHHFFVLSKIHIIFYIFTRFVHHNYDRDVSQQNFLLR